MMIGRQRRMCIHIGRGPVGGAFIVFGVMRGCRFHKITGIPIEYHGWAVLLQPPYLVRF